MKINFTDILKAFSYALDCVENEFLGTTTNHSKRVAYISTVLGRGMGLTDDQLMDLAGCAILHDSALTEYLRIKCNKELLYAGDKKEIGLHCQLGEDNVKNLPFSTDISGAVLYHHEKPDGSGAFGRKLNETPLLAQLIHFADELDLKCDLGNFSEDKYQVMVAYLKNNSGTVFAAEHVKLFLDTFGLSKLLAMQNDIDALLEEELPQHFLECQDSELKSISDMFARIIDYKSAFTMNHSLGIAKKAEIMADFYGYDKLTKQKLYFAGAVHDLGKLIIKRDVLEKNGKLSEDEFLYIQTHASYTYKILSQIKGLEDVTAWASYHHEKLNGRGYPFGKKAADLDKNSRLMACLDIYQALREKRPYKKPMSHQEALTIMYKMADDNFIDREIIDDIDKVFAEIN